MRIVCLSDTHNCNEKIAVPDGDFLIHSGDATIHGTKQEVEDFLIWFSSLPHKYKIFVAGNHDWLYESDNQSARLLTANYGITYLQDSSVVIENLKIYGSPWQPRFYNWAFNLDRGIQLAEKWNKIPKDVDILITHGPPIGILDEVPTAFGIEKTGCEELLKKVHELSKENLKLHIFGHIHCGYGQTEKFGVRFINASNCDEDYLPNNFPIVIDL